MNKTEFINALEQKLLRLSKADRDDILLDYEEHFRAGVEQGLTEEDVAERLGSVDEVAAQYLLDLPADAKGAPASLKTEEKLQPEPEKPEEPEAPAYTPYTPPTTGASAAPSTTYTAPVTSAPARKSGGISDSRGLNILLVVLLWLFVLIPLFSSLVGLWLSLCGSALALIILAATLVGCCFFAVSAPLVMVGLILLGIASAALGALCIIGSVYGMKGLIALLRMCIDLSSSLIDGGEAK